MGYGKSYGNTIKVIVEAPVYMLCRPVFALGCCLSGAPYIGACSQFSIPNFPQILFV